nr:hypothetical protein BaRGS_008756 [Batillaria attramentaria]
MYAQPLSQVIERFSISYHAFADDTQLHDSCPPDQIHDTIKSLQEFDPGQATMGATPKLTVYSYNTFLSLTCSGDVGTVDDTTKVC